jgi:hypothetical protein
MRVEFLWWEGCPSHPEALGQLKGVLREEGLDPDAIVLREIESDDQARDERFPGSPTIRIDGQDVVQPAEGEPMTLTCRVYQLRDGRTSPTPDLADLRDAVRAAKARVPA